MIVWRLCKTEYSDLIGRGSFLYGGRWNSPGHSMVYTSSSLSLSCLEILVGLSNCPFPRGFVSLQIDIPDQTSCQIIDIDEFPKKWNKSKDRSWFLHVGNEWLLSKKTAVLSVPSVIIQTERNFLINPDHPESKEIKIIKQEPFEMDERLIQ